MEINFEEVFNNLEQYRLIDTTVDDESNAEIDSNRFLLKVVDGIGSAYKPASPISSSNGYQSYTPITPKAYPKTKSGYARDDFRALVAKAHGQAATGKWKNMPDWSLGPEFDALDDLIYKESGRNPGSQNVKSTAYGLFQFLNDTWAGYGVPKTADAIQQTVAGLRYIYSKYKTPSRALDFWTNKAPKINGSHWY